MGFFDSAKNTLQGAANRGGAAAQRAARNVQIQLELDNLRQRRTVAAAEFGASVYEALDSFPGLREGRQDLIDSIAALDVKQKQLEDELAEIAAASEEAARTRNEAMSQARETMSAAMSQARESMGAAVTTARETVNGYTKGVSAPKTVPDGMFVCTKCGELVAEGDSFCMGCGSPVAEIKPAQEAEE